MKDTAVLCSVKRPSSPVIPLHVAQTVEHGVSVWVQTLIALDSRNKEKESERVAAETARKEQELVSRQLVEALARKKEFEARLEAQACELAALQKATDDNSRLLAEGAVMYDEKRRALESQLAELEEQLATVRREEEDLERRHAQLEEEVQKKQMYKKDVDRECESLEPVWRQLEAELEEALQQCSEEDVRQRRIGKQIEEAEEEVRELTAANHQLEKELQTTAEARRVEERYVKWMKEEGIEQRKMQLRGEEQNREKNWEWDFFLISASDETANKSGCQLSCQLDHTGREIGQLGENAAQQPKVLVFVDMSIEEREEFIQIYNNLETTDEASLKKMQGFLRKYGGRGLKGNSKAIYVAKW